MFLRIIRHLIVFATLVSTWLGFLYFAKDYSEREEAYTAWEQLMPISLEMALLIFSGLCVVYILWRDFQDSILPLFAYRIGLWKDERMSVPEVVKYAENKLGWTIQTGETLHALDLVDALGDAAANGKVRVYGRYNPERYSNLRDKYLKPIPLDHWHDHSMDIFNTVLLGENRRTASRPRNERDREAYIDLHFNRQDIKRFLSREGYNWRGMHLKEEARQERRVAYVEMINQKDEPVAHQSHSS